MILLTRTFSSIYPWYSIYVPVCLETLVLGLAAEPLSGADFALPWLGSLQCFFVVVVVVGMWMSNDFEFTDGFTVIFPLFININNGRS